MGSHSWMRTEQPRGMLRQGWWKQEGDWGHMTPEGTVGRRNAIGWDNPAAEQSGSCWTVAEPPCHPNSPHAGSGFVPRWAAAPSSLSLSCIPQVMEMRRHQRLWENENIPSKHGGLSDQGLFCLVWLAAARAVECSNASGGWECPGEERFIVIYCAGQYAWAQAKMGIRSQ